MRGGGRYGTVARARIAERLGKPREWVVFPAGYPIFTSVVHIVSRFGKRTLCGMAVGPTAERVGRPIPGLACMRCEKHPASSEDISSTL
jgi:hypothetical protein